MTELTPEARKLKNAVSRKYYRDHPEKRREQNARYWNKKAARMAAGNYDIAEARVAGKQKKELDDLLAHRRETEQRTDISEETRRAKLNVIDREIEELKSDSRRR